MNKKQTVTCQFNSHASLTKGNTYEIVKEEDNKIFVVNDKGKLMSYYKSRFK